MSHLCQILTMKCGHALIIRWRPTNFPKMFRMGKVKVDLIFPIIKEKVGESSKLCRDKW